MQQLIIISYFEGKKYCLQYFNRKQFGSQQHIKIITLMFQEKVFIPNQLPLPDKNRRCTDIFCTVIGAALALTLFIVACIFWNKDKFEKQFFGVLDGKGEPCPDDNVLHIKDYTNLTTSTCVRSCPVGYFQSQRVCLPESQQQLKEYLQNTDIVAPLQFTQFKWVLFYTAIIALGLGLAWFTIVQCLPRFAPILAHVGSILALIALGVLALVLYDNFWSNILWLKIVIAVICFLLAIISFVMLCLYANAIKFQGLFLHYSSRFLAKHPATFLYLIVYLIFMIGLVALTVWQHCCYTSQSAYSRNFFDFTNGGVWQILNIIQFIWGVQFLRDSFNFCVSGAATDYYWKDNDKQGCFNPYRRLICNHWGSVVGGSFLNAFFQIPTLIVQFLTCHPTACFGKLGVCCHNNCSCLTCFFDLVRTDAYSYINIAGIPFCNSARQCKKLCEESKHFVGSYSPMKHYRLICHLFAVTSAFIAAWFVLRARLWVYGFWHLTLLVVVIYCVVTWFINIHADAAEGLQTSYLSEHILEANHTLLQKLHPDYMAQLDQWQKRQKTDGNF